MFKITQVEKDQHKEARAKYEQEIARVCTEHLDGDLKLCHHVRVFMRRAFTAGFAKRGKLQCDPEFRRIRAEQLSQR